MPELPEVEFCARLLRRAAVGRVVLDAGALPGTPLRGGLDPARFSKGLDGRRIRAVERRGKQIWLRLDGPDLLLIHLGMTGKWVVGEGARARPGSRVWLRLDDGSRLDCLDPRRFGRIHLLSEAEALTHPEVAHLGPDALTLADAPEILFRALAGTRRPVKEALMDQHRIAGVGNIYAAEALFEARIHPQTPCAQLDADACRRLALAVVGVMHASLARETAEEITYLHEAQSSNPFAVYGRTGQPCLRCGCSIGRIVQQQRSTFFCPTCQLRPG